MVLHAWHTIVCGEWVVGLLEGSVESLGDAGLDLVVGFPILGTHCSSQPCSFFSHCPVVLQTVCLHQTARHVIAQLSHPLY